MVRAQACSVRGVKRRMLGLSGLRRPEVEDQPHSIGVYCVSAALMAVATLEKSTPISLALVA
jgi:hypothetical protein